MSLKNLIEVGYGDKTSGYSTIGKIFTAVQSL